MRYSLLGTLPLLAIATRANAQVAPLPHPARTDTVGSAGMPARIVPFRKVTLSDHAYVPQDVTYLIDSARVFVPAYPDAALQRAFDKLFERLEADSIKDLKVYKGPNAAKLNGCPGSAVIVIATMKGNWSARTLPTSGRRLDTCP